MADKATQKQIDFIYQLSTIKYDPDKLSKVEASKLIKKLKAPADKEKGIPKFIPIEKYFDDNKMKILIGKVKRIQKRIENSGFNDSVIKAEYGTCEIENMTEEQKVRFSDIRDFVEKYIIRSLPWYISNEYPLSVMFINNVEYQYSLCKMFTDYYKLYHNCKILKIVSKTK